MCKLGIVSNCSCGMRRNSAPNGPGGRRSQPPEPANSIKAAPCSRVSKKPKRFWTVTKPQRSRAMTDQIQDDLLKALAVTAELMGTPMSPEALAVFVEDLLAYDAALVLKALRRTRQEVTGRLTLAAILQRLDDGRPTPEEAWAMIPASEQVSFFWTEEMAVAYGVAGPLRAAEDEIGARLSFTKQYLCLLAEARAKREPVKWRASLGYDPAGREPAIRDALRLGRITHAYATTLLPHWEDAVPQMCLPEHIHKLLEP